MKLLLGVFVAATLSAEVSFPTADGGVVYADIYGSGDRGLVLAHGARFDKASWKGQAQKFAEAGYHVVAIDFRGYGKSHGPDKAHLYEDVLAAVQYLRGQGAKTVAVLGGSMGGGAAANAVVEGPAGAIDRLVLLAHAPIQKPEKITGPKLFIAAQGDPITARVKEQYENAPQPKELVLLDGSAHAQFLFTTDQSERLMREILRFLAAPSR